jgi:hypothetical protein
MTKVLDCVECLESGHTHRSCNASRSGHIRRCASFSGQVNPLDGSQRGDRILRGDAGSGQCRCEHVHGCILLSNFASDGRGMMTRLSVLSYGRGRMTSCLSSVWNEKNDPLICHQFWKGNIDPFNSVILRPASGRRTSRECVRLTRAHLAFRPSSSGLKARTRHPQG